ncbi:MAG: DUF1731 domain-containing protein [Thermoflexibacter sp.]|nr:DUF1731 domain-containing protein [Thermoflexibacter sp.]
MSKNILISGGTGLVGQRLTEILLHKGYIVSYLTRNKNGLDSIEYKSAISLSEVIDATEEELRRKALGKRLAHDLTVTNIDRFLDNNNREVIQEEKHEIFLQKGHLITEFDIESMLESRVEKISIYRDNAYIKLYEWDIKKKTIEQEAIQNADYIIHLAGAGVADATWTDVRKKEILDSRTLSTQLLVDTLLTQPNKVQAFISASAIGYYGLDTGNAWQYEGMESSAKDFLAQVVKAWESAIFKAKDVRTVAIRIGVVLSAKGGALAKIAQPIQLYTGAALGSGLQYVSWIHIDDLCEIFVKAIEDKEMSGIYNGVAPDGEMSAIVLGGNRVSSEKIEKAGYVFKFRQLEQAIKDLL